MSSHNGYNYSTEWSSMRRREVPTHSPQSDAEFEAMVTRSLAREKKTLTDELEEEERMWYGNNHYSGERLFRWLYSANPRRARRRVEELYWQGWREVTYAFLLTGTGTFLFILGCMVYMYSNEVARGLTLLLMSLLLCLPGYYSAFVIAMYLCCKKGYSYKQLVIDESEDVRHQ